MRALSVRPPWAYYIIYGVPYFEEVKNENGSTSLKQADRVIFKDIENRNWRLPNWFRLPQRVYIHAGKAVDVFDAVVPFTVGKLGLPLMSIVSSFSRLLPKGALIGTVEIIEQVTESDSPWFVGPYGFVLRNPEPLGEPIPCRGKLGLFRTWKEVNE